MGNLRIERPCDRHNIDQAKRAVEGHLAAIGDELTDEDDKRPLQYAEEAVRDEAQQRDAQAQGCSRVRRCASSLAIGRCW
ncbi:MAG: hypothetical protein IPM35_33580 [Myxococcales bacterium]|nr:hypothetical protein [Myxococcales bacterium]